MKFLTNRLNATAFHNLGNLAAAGSSTRQRGLKSCRNGRWPDGLELGSTSPAPVRRGLALWFLAGSLDGSDDGGGAEQNSYNQGRHAPKEFVAGAIGVYSGAYP